MTATVRTTRCSCTASGLTGGCAVSVRSAISASRVRSPVARTWATASPSVANVPAHARPTDLSPRELALAGPHRLVQAQLMSLHKAQVCAHAVATEQPGPACRRRVQGRRPTTASGRRSESSARPADASVRRRVVREGCSGPRAAAARPRRGNSARAAAPALRRRRLGRCLPRGGAAVPATPPRKPSSWKAAGTSCSALLSPKFRPV